MLMAAWLYILYCLVEGLKDLWFSYQATSTSLTKTNIVSAEKHLAAPAAMVKGMARTGMPIGARDHVCAQVISGKNHPGYRVQQHLVTR